MFGEEGYNPFQAQHAQCNTCGVMTRGPHKDKVFEDHNVFAADRERVYTRDEAEAVGLRHNVSGSYCPDCFQAQKAKWAAERAQAQAKERSRRVASSSHRAEVKEQRRLAREQKKVQAVDQEQNIAPAERARRAYAERGKQSARKVEGMPPEGEGEAS